METSSKATVLYEWHVEKGANMASFGGYQMPLWYPSGVKKEHRAVLTHAGLFDTSHMAVLTIEGNDAFKVLQSAFTKDLTSCIGKDKSALSPGRCVYGAFLNEKGHVIDDAIVYHFTDDRYMTVVNAGMGPVIASHLTKHASGLDVVVTDLSDKVGKMDVQGPLSAQILSNIIASPGTVFDRLPYFAFKGHFDTAPAPRNEPVTLLDGTPLLISRTGYTGEFGFELFIAQEHTLTLWNAILDAGSDLGIIPCALAARDSLRAGAKLPLSHQDIGPWPFLNHPWLFALPYDESGRSFTKDFIGKDALLRSDYREYTLAFAGFDLRKVSTAGETMTFDSSGTNIGSVLTCATDTAIARVDNRIVSIVSPDRPDNFDPKGLSCGFIKVGRQLSPGEIVTLSDGRRSLAVEIIDDIRPHRTARKALKEFL